MIFLDLYRRFDRGVHRENGRTGNENKEITTGGESALSAPEGTSRTVRQHLCRVREERLPKHQLAGIFLFMCQSINTSRYYTTLRT